jgi:hypothetical protein
MKTLGLISCTKDKQIYPCAASEMYSASNLFRKAYTYCDMTYDDVAILSAKYGLLLPDDKIKPYNVTLNKMSVQERRVWSDKVFEQMQSRLILSDYHTIFFHAGKNYRIFLAEKLENSNLITEAPLGNLQIGKQLEWYKKKNLMLTFRLVL